MQTDRKKSQQTKNEQPGTILKGFESQPNLIDIELLFFCQIVPWGRLVLEYLSILKFQTIQIHSWCFKSCYLHFFVRILIGIAQDLAPFWFAPFFLVCF